MNNFIERGISENASKLNESVTHGATANVRKLNKDSIEGQGVIDLSIGTLDMVTDDRIDKGVIDFINTDSEAIHGFAPVKGFPFLLNSIANRIKRLHDISYNPEEEIMVTPGGIKGSISVAFHTLLNPGDEVVVPLPNWPHYADMIRLHGAEPVFVFPTDFSDPGMKPDDLLENISESTKIVILGDCINPTGKVYSTEELSSLAKVISHHNLERNQKGLSPIFVLFDCPYEAHILDERAKTFANLCIEHDGKEVSMRPYTVTVTGPGKTYGMHGDRIGYLCAAPEIVENAARVQVNMNSFASTYAQVATHHAMQEAMDEVAINRARHARRNLDEMVRMLNNIPSVSAYRPNGSYFIFVDFSECASLYKKLGYSNAEEFLLQESKVATISGSHFAKGSPAASDFNHYVRINCGRSIAVLREAANRIKESIAASQ